MKEIKEIMAYRVKNAADNIYTIIPPQKEFSDIFDCRY